MPANRVLETMLDRLFASLISGPNLNCRPHASRQRIDLTAIDLLKDVSPGSVLSDLLSKEGRSRIVGRVKSPARSGGSSGPIVGRFRPRSDDESIDPATRAWVQQQNVLQKLRTLTEDALTYEQDTGAHVLSVGYPLLNLPPGSFAGSRRIMAPVAFIPVSLSVRTGMAPSVEIQCCGANADLLTPNLALLAWVQQQTGKEPGELMSDNEGKFPWQELCSLVAEVGKLLDLPVPETWRNAELPMFELLAAPRGDSADEVTGFLSSAVLGLFPQPNQSLLRDTQEMIKAPSLAGPVEPFIDVRTSLVAREASDDVNDEPLVVKEKIAAPLRKRRVVAEDRLVTSADPCQARAVRLARACQGLVIHGPPGTGKSQTITNIIGDHLANGQRVLFVCDKRTALDVVANRLEHLGLGDLCAVIHDPQSDRRNLYQSLRSRLESLPETRTESDAQRRLQALDVELQSLHDLLTDYCSAVSAPQGDQPSMHDLIAQWLALHQVQPAPIDSAKGGPLTLEDWRNARPAVEDVLTRARIVGWSTNPWAKCAGISLEDFLGRTMTEIRSKMQALAASAREVDATRHAGSLPFKDGLPLEPQADVRARLADRLSAALASVTPALASRWSAEPIAAVRQARQNLTDIEAYFQTFRLGPLDAELSLSLATGNTPAVAQINQCLAAIDAYLAIASLWHGLFHLTTRRLAREALAPYGLPLTIDNAKRLRTFCVGLRARLVIASLHDQLTGSASRGLLPDAALTRFADEYPLLLDLIIEAQDVPGLPALIGELFVNEEKASSVLEGLRIAQGRATSVTALINDLSACQLFDSATLTTMTKRLLAGKAASADMNRLLETIESLDGVLRLRRAVSQLPPNILPAVSWLLRSESESIEASLAAIDRAVLEAEISRLCRSMRSLQEYDAHQLKNSFERYRLIELTRPSVVRAMILHRWRSQQKSRLLASTESRLNGAGADLKRRLTARGDNAMRLRQVIAVGQSIEGGDPLFDLCPVWMASPETVAQLFPLQAMFDVVIFDEASQCRLEHALPVLMRGKRVVVAGDPKQLPPTRFFESAVATSQSEEAETEQDLFESQQTTIEDLLAAALNLEIQECYLDVHYRSRNADLISFSNEHFYGSRLQAIPAHPANRTRFAPLSLRQVRGVYKDRCNEAEAKEVARIVSDLLRRAEPPSIGVACFNLAQRDLIIETLDDMAEQDPEFASRLAKARARRGEGSYEGLFVRNLESVQGDERDHIIISTTYGPDEQGRFYRRFGPLGMAGGGRRMNVLVTRARHEVHLVTSIPPEVYLSLPPVPPGAQPGGPWLLFSYLQYADSLKQIYDTAPSAIPEENTLKTVTPTVEVCPAVTPSALAGALANHLLDTRATGSIVHWGNEGFCVDVALRHPHRVHDVTIGLLCDGTRYDKAADPVEWDVFRTAILQSQGWKLHRVWSPHFFRDSVAALNAIATEAKNNMEPATR